MREGKLNDDCPQTRVSLDTLISPVFVRVRMSAKRIKVNLALTLLVSLAALCGCAHRYLMKLSNGDHIISVSKPKLEGTNYHFRDDLGQECVIPRSRVVNIETGAVVAEEKKTVAPTTPRKARHWYFLWLA